MNVTVEKLPHSRAKLTLTIEAGQVQAYVEGAARELSTEHPLKGFRPGAVPLDMMRSAVGDAALVEHALKKLVPKTYIDALMEHEELEAIGRPDVEVKEVEIGKDWVYEATVAVLPDVQLGAYQRVRAEKKPVTIDTQAVERELDVLRKMRASYLSVVRPAQTGDRVEVDISASVDHVPLEQGSGRRQPLILGEGHLIPGFEDHIVGMKEGETKTFPLRFPDTHHQTDLRSKAVDFTVKVITIQQRVLPALDDTFAKGLGTFAGIDDLRAKLQENLQAEQTHKERQRYQMELLQQVVKDATFGEFPAMLVDSEVEKMLAELTAGLRETGLSLDQYLLNIKKTIEEVREGFRPQALDRVRAGLALRALAKAEKVDVSDTEVAEEVDAALRQFPNVEEAKKQVDLEELTNVAASMVRNRKVLERLEHFAAG